MTQLSADNALLQAWSLTRERFGAAPAIYSPAGNVLRTFAQIEEEAEKAGRMFDSLRPHTVVAVQIGNCEYWPELLLALWRRELIPLPLGEMGAPELDTTLGACGALALVTLEKGHLAVHPRPSAAKPIVWPGITPQFLKLTSGTTSVARAVCFRASQLLADSENICATMGITSEDINFGVIPFSHSYGFSNLITPLLSHGVRLVVSNDRLPRAILEGIASSQATVLPATPYFFQKFAEIERVPPLPSLRLCISAGALLARQPATLFTEKFGLKIHTFYGASECGGIAYDASEEGTYEDGFVGQPMEGVTLEHSAESGGPIVVRGAAVGLGYFPQPEESPLDDGQFIPADVVQRSARGIYLIGRTSDVINVAGRKLNPLEVEARLAEFPGIRQAVVFGVASAVRGEIPVACVVGKNLAREAVLRFCQEKLSAWQVPRDIWVVREIPSNERGKISRRALAESYRAQKSPCP